jgi:hypothetical protein
VSAGPGRLELLRWQLRLAWSLADVHLPALTDEMCRWLPAPGAWTVHRREDGRWVPDWAEPEPDPAPPASIGWLTWHLGWWWSALIGHTQGTAVPPRAEVDWPGDAAATARWLTDLHATWSRLLDDLDEEAADRPVAFPWPEPRPLALAVAWANQELMKNVAEIGAVRHLHAARADGARQ